MLISTVIWNFWWVTLQLFLSVEWLMGVSFSGFRVPYSTPENGTNWRMQTSYRADTWRQRIKGVTRWSKRALLIHKYAYFIQIFQHHLHLFLVDEMSKLTSYLPWLIQLQCWLKITREQRGKSTNQASWIIAIKSSHSIPSLSSLPKATTSFRLGPHSHSNHVLDKEAPATISQKELVFSGVLFNTRRSLREHTC